MIVMQYKDEVAQLGYTDTNMLNMTQQRNILDAARHCRLAHVRLSTTSSQMPTVLTDNKAAADLIVLTVTKPLTAPPTGIGFGRPPPLSGLEILMYLGRGLHNHRHYPD